MRTVERRSLFTGTLALELLSSALVANPAGAQQRDAPVEVGLQCFEEMQRLSAPRCSQMTGEVVMSVVIQWQRYRPAVVDSVLDGLERLALTSDNKRVRISAAIWLGTPGAVDPPMPGIIDRLTRVYRSSKDPTVRGALIGPALRQADTAVALRFLEMVAQDDRPEDRLSDEPPQRAAVEYLAHLGARGRAVLERLHEAGAVKVPIARARLDHLARANFQPR